MTAECGLARLGAPSTPAAAAIRAGGGPYRNTNRKFCDPHHMRQAGLGSTLSSRRSKTGGSENVAHNFGGCRRRCRFGPKPPAGWSLRSALVRSDVGRRRRHALGLPLPLDRRMPTERARGQSWLVQSEPLLCPGCKTSEFSPSHPCAIRSPNEPKAYCSNGNFGLRDRVDADRSPVSVSECRGTAV